MSIPLPIPGNNALTTFVYEPFSYTISNPAPGTYTLTTSNSPGIPSGYITNNGTEVVFSTLSNTMAPTGNLPNVFTVTALDASLNIVAVSSNNVSVEAGRFRDLSGNGYTGRSFSFFKNEPIAPIPLIAPFAIATPTSVPTLPPGLAFVSNASNQYSIAGTPIVTVPQSNYLFIGKGIGSNLGKIVTASQVGISVSNERLLLNLSGSPVVSPMTVGTPISQRVITAAFPPYPSGGALRYTWSGLPDGIVITDICGNTQPGMFMPTDASYSLVLKGTPTLAAANAFRDAGVTSNVVTITATRTAPLPQISNSATFVFAFGETVLFDTTNVPRLYVSSTLDASAISFRAQTYFGSGSAISNIFSPDLRSDLSLNFVPSQGRAYLTGTPQFPTGTNTYTIRAINSNAISRDLPTSITVSNDVITFVPVTDICYNFVISRPSSLALAGYYPSNIQFRATAASGNAVTYNGDDLDGTGLQLTPSNGIATITGTPTTVTPLKNVRITASNGLTSAFVDISLAVLDDVFTFTDISSLQFIQNRVISPIQLSVSTLSERSVVSFTSSNLPNGLSLSTTGRITGTPLGDTSGNFDVVATTGYSSGTKNYTYSLTPDSILFALNQLVYTYPAGNNVDIPIKALAYSGNTVSNYAFSNFAQSYGLSIDSSSGLISGPLSDSIPPNPILPVLSNFAVTGNSGLLTGNLPATLQTANPVVYRSFLLSYAYSNSSIKTFVYPIDGGQRGAFDLISDDKQSLDFQVKNISVDSNICMATIPETGRILRSSNGVNFSFLDLNRAAFIPKTSYLANKTGTNTWWVSGYDVITSTAFIIKSVDDGATWDVSGRVNIPGLYARNLNGLAIGAPTDIAYVLGLPLRYKDGTLVTSGLLSGLRSTNDGSNWSSISIFSSETANMTLEDSNTWVAVGSDDYFTISNQQTYTSPTRTIKYSTDQGQTWTGGFNTFNFFGYEVAYGCNTWVATGASYSNVPDPGYFYEVKYSTDGVTWSNVDLSTNYLFGSPASRPVPQIPLGSLMFDGSNFNIVVYRETSPNSFITEIYKHDILSSLASNWTVSSIPNPTPEFSNVAYPKITPPIYVRTGTPTLATFSFNALPPGGPVFTSPTQSSFIFYQYATIQPIQFSATGTGTVYYFVDTNEVPRGLSFDPVTGILSGRSVQFGPDRFSVYAKDDIGVTRLDITTNTILPSIVRQQTSAGAWTSLVRQYTVVNAAQNSVNGKTLPATEPLLGEFTRPEPPDSVSATGNPNCKC